MKIYNTRNVLFIIYSGFYSCTISTPPSALILKEAGCEQKMNKVNGSSPLENLALGTLVCALPATVIYKQNKQVKKLVDASALFARNLAIKSVARVVIKWEEIKDYGLSLADVAKAGGICAAAYGLANAVRFFNVWGFLTTGDTSRTNEAFSEAYEYLSTHKERICGISLCSVWAYILWKWSRAPQFNAITSNSVDCYNEVPFIDQFMKSLTEDQRGIIANSQELSTLMTEAKDDPTVLLLSPDFMALLDSDQAVTLDKALDEHIINCSKG